MRDLHKSPLKLGIIGCGNFLLRRILPVLKNVETIRIVAIQNRNQEKAKKIAEQHAIPNAFTQKEELLAHSEVEAIHIASPNFLHEEDALACAAAGKPTLCEKPLSTSLTSIKKMILAFQQKGIPFLVGHQLRFKPAVQKAKQLLQSGELGQLLHLRAYYYSQTIPEDNWRFKQGNGGGALQEIGVHLLDLIHFITEEKITHFHAITMPTRPREAERMVSFQGQLQSGSLVSFECAFERPYYNGFELIGTKGRLQSLESLRQTADPVESLCLALNTGEKIFFPLTATDLYVEEFKHFAQAAICRIPSPLSAEISIPTQAIIDAVYTQINSSIRKAKHTQLAPTL